MIYLCLHLNMFYFQNLNVAAITPIMRILMNCAASVHGTAVEVRLKILKAFKSFEGNVYAKKHFLGTLDYNDVLN